MTGFLWPILVLTWKDILLELRTKDMVTSIFVFGLLTAIIFNFAFDPTPAVVAMVVPGIIWVAFTFAGVLGFNRAFVLEKDRGSLEGLLQCPVSRDVIYFGKLLGIVLFMLVAEAILFPIFAVLYNFSLANATLFLIAVLATLGFAAVGTLFSAMAVNTRSREIMLPVLLLPVAAPVVIAAVAATSDIMGGASLGDVSRWLQLPATFAAIFLIVASFVFGAVLEA